MPRRRDPELMTFTKVRKKDRANKAKNMEIARDLVDQYSHIYVFDTRNYKSGIMGQVRNRLKFEGRFFMGKVRPTLVSLGRSARDEYRENLHLLCRALESAKTNSRGFYFTNKGPEEALSTLKGEALTAFAKTGFVATTDYIVRKGLLSMFSFCQETQLKRLGLPVLLKRGKLLLNQDYVVCEKGQPLRPEQAKLLELFGVKMAKFEFVVYGYWTGNEYRECLEQYEALGNGADSADSAESEDEAHYLASELMESAEDTDDE